MLKYFVHYLIHFLGIVRQKIRDDHCEQLRSNSTDNAYQGILRKRLLLLEKYYQMKSAPGYAKAFRNEWAKLDADERKLVEGIKCIGDLLVSKRIVDKATGTKTNVTVCVIRKGQTWKYHNMDGIAADARAVIGMNYHPPPTINQKDGETDWNNGCVLANLIRAPTTIQRMNKGPLTNECNLSGSTKDCIKRNMTIFDLYSFRPKTKDYYLKEAQQFAMSAGVNLLDVQLSGLLQLAGQAMSTHLEGHALHFTIGSAHAKKKFHYIGAAVSKCCFFGGDMPHGEALSRPGEYMTAHTFSDSRLVRFSLAANIVFTPVPSIVTGYDPHTMMVLAQREPMTEAEKKLLFNSRSVRSRSTAFTASDSTSCTFLFHEGQNRVYVIGNKQSTSQFSAAMLGSNGKNISRSAFCTLELSTTVNTLDAGLELEEKLNEEIEELDDVPLDGRISAMDKFGVIGYTPATIGSSRASRGTQRMTEQEMKAELRARVSAIW